MRSVPTKNTSSAGFSSFLGAGVGSGVGVGIGAAGGGFACRRPDCACADTAKITRARIVMSRLSFMVAAADEVVERILALDPDLLHCSRDGNEETARYHTRSAAGANHALVRSSTERFW